MIEAATARLEGAQLQFRRWLHAFETHVLAESMEPGASASTLARRLGMTTHSCSRGSAMLSES